MQQRVRNACGTVAVAHAIANSGDSFALEEGSVMERFLECCSGSADPAERGATFAEDEAIHEAHKACVVSEHNQTVSPEAGSQIAEHFCAFVHVNGNVFELDGSFEQQPIDHGPTTPDSF